MATAAEIAQERANEKLRRAGLDPSGNPIGDMADQATDEEESYDDDDDLTGDSAAEKTEASFDREVNELRRELEQLRQQNAALQGRVAPTQQELELQRTEARVLRHRLEQAERERQAEIDRLKQELDSSKNQMTIEDILTEEEREQFDPDTLNAFLRIADKVAERKIPRVDIRGEALKALQEREAQRVQEYRERVLLDPSKGLHNLDTLSRDPAFMAWAQSDEIDLDSTLNSLLRAKTEEDVERYVKIASRKIAQYNVQSKSQAGSKRNAPSGSDPNVRLSAGMRRGSSERESHAQRDAKLAEARRLARSSSMHDRAKAKAILDSLS